MKNELLTSQNTLMQGVFWGSKKERVFCLESKDHGSQFHFNHLVSITRLVIHYKSYKLSLNMCKIWTIPMVFRCWFLSPSSSLLQQLLSTLKKKGAWCPTNQNVEYLNIHMKINVIWLNFHVCLYNVCLLFVYFLSWETHVFLKITLII